MNPCDKPNLSAKTAAVVIWELLIANVTCFFEPNSSACELCAFQIPIKFGVWDSWWVKKGEIISTVEVPNYYLYIKPRENMYSLALNEASLKYSQYIVHMGMHVTCCLFFGCMIHAHHNCAHPKRETFNMLLHTNQLANEFGLRSKLIKEHALQSPGQNRVSGG